jgi:hypothetical protein
MFEFAAAEFDSLMYRYVHFRRQPADPLMASGSLVLGMDELRYSDDETSVVFVGSSAAMQLRIVRRTRGGPEHVLVDKQYTDFGEVREALREHLG